MILLYYWTVWKKLSTSLYVRNQKHLNYVLLKGLSRKIVISLHPHGLMTFFTHIFTDALITLANKKTLFSKRTRIFYIFWKGMMSWTRCCLQFSPKLNSFPVIMCWNLPKMQNFAATLILHWPEKVSVYQKNFKVLTYSGVELCPQHDVVFRFS